MKIPLFDIDNTLLVGSNSVHQNAFHYAFKTIYSLPQAYLSDIDHQGKLDYQLIVEVCQFHNLDEVMVKKHIHDAAEVMVNYVRDHKAEIQNHVADGAIDLLTVLKQQTIPIGLLTGNIQEIARIKLSQTEIWPFIDFGAFGNMAYHRPDLVSVASREASTLFGQFIPVNQFVIIGDTPRDIATAQSVGIPSIGVATGSYSEADLRTSGATLTVPNLLNPQPILDFITC